MDYKQVMPKPVDLGRLMNGCMGEPIINYEDKGNYNQNPQGLRTVMGYNVPDWQRPLVWSMDQNVKLIESLWLGLPIGTYTFNRKYGSKFDNLLIDGQQRMNAIEMYLNDVFNVFGYTYSETGLVDKRYFRNSAHFPAYITETDDETYLRNYYNMMNFSGTHHTDDQRA